MDEAPIRNSSGVQISAVEIYRLESLAAGPKAAGAVEHHEMGANLLRLRFGVPGSKARHTMFLTIVADRQILILRILHDSMDPTRHLPGDNP